MAGGSFESVFVPIIQFEEAIVSDSPANETKGLLSFSEHISAREAARRRKEEEQKQKDVDRQKEMSLKMMLLEEVQKRTAIWDRKALNYRKKFATEQLWSQISNKLGISKDWCKKKWKSMIDIFRDLLNEKSTSSSTDLTKITWPYYNNMLFMKNVIARNKDCEDSGVPAAESEESVGNSNNVEEINNDGKNDSEDIVNEKNEDDEVVEKDIGLKMDVEVVLTRDDVIEEMNDQDNYEYEPNPLSFDPEPEISLPLDNRKKRKKQRDDEHDILANELININQQMESINQDPTVMFGKYAILLIKELPTDKRRKCEQDVLRIINGYIQNCEVDVAVFPKIQ